MGFTGSWLFLLQYEGKQYNVVGLWDSAETIVQIYVLFTNWSWTGTDSSAFQVDEDAP